MYRPILLSLATAVSLAAGTMIADGRASHARVVANPVRTADARAEATRIVDDAVAAALIGSISGQFDTDDVTVQLDDVDLAPLSPRDRQVRGTGRLRIDGEPQWITFGFDALYDTETAEVSHPRLAIASAAVAPAAADARLAAGLGTRVGEALAAEFAGQPVTWTQGRTLVAGGDARYAHVTGTGLADFGPEGTVDARVDALYDRHTGRWLRVSYELGAGDAGALDGAVASL
jgi:hypothetical protein